MSCTRWAKTSYKNKLQNCVISLREPDKCRCRDNLNGDNEMVGHDILKEISSSLLLPRRLGFKRANLRNMAV
jgi:hypothetical protein